MKIILGSEYRFATPQNERKNNFRNHLPLFGSFDKSQVTDNIVIWYGSIDHLMIYTTRSNVLTMLMKTIIMRSDKQ